MKLVEKSQFEEVQIFKFGSWPFGKPSMFSYIFFLDGLMIDTGHRNMRNEVFQELNQLPVSQIFITHHHEDHTGNLLPIQEHFKCPTYASPRCIELMKQPPKISFAQQLTWGKSDPFTNFQPIKKTLSTPNYHFELIPIPGHAEDMYGLYEANKGWFFSADLWVYHYIRYFMRPESMKTQIASIKKVLKLDFDVLLCSHNPQFKDGKIKLQRKLDFFEDFYGKAAMFYHQGFTKKEIFKKMKLKENWSIRILSGGALSTMNMIQSVIRDEVVVL